MTDQAASQADPAPLTEDRGGVDPRMEGQASQWQLIWWRFKRHRLAMASGILVLALYLIAIFAEVLAPFEPTETEARYTYAPPQELNLFHDGRWEPHVLGYRVEIEPEALRRVFVVDESQVVPVAFFQRVETYYLMGFIPLNRKFLAPKNAGDPMYLLGADRLGRDVLSRLIHGTRISLSVGLVGVLASLVLGIFIGGISGYVGGRVDFAVQRVIEFLRSLPTIPLWLGLAAALPRDWSSLQIYFAITIILSLIGWTELARVVRGRFLSMKTEDFVLAAEFDGASKTRIILRHMVPSFTSHIVAAATLAVPGMILAETALSFLGLGLQPPTVSWGVLLQEAQSIRVLSTAPWLFWPGGVAVVTILAMNFLGDGLRDAADPYEH